MTRQRVQGRFQNENEPELSRRGSPNAYNVT